MRVVHHAPPPVATSDTRSPSRTPFFRNSDTAALARWAWKGVRWMSSKTRTNERPVRDSAVWLLEMRGRSGVVSLAVAGTCTLSKLAMVCGLSSSRIWKSAAVSPVTGTPFLSVTTTSTVTCSTSVGKRGESAVTGASAAAGAVAGDGAAAAEGDGSGACARRGPARTARRTGPANGFFIIIVGRGGRGARKADGAHAPPPEHLIVAS